MLDIMNNFVDPVRVDPVLTWKGRMKSELGICDRMIQTVRNILHRGAITCTVDVTWLFEPGQNPADACFVVNRMYLYG